MKQAYSQRKRWVREKETSEKKDKWRSKANDIHSAKINKWIKGALLPGARTEPIFSGWIKTEWDLASHFSSLASVFKLASVLMILLVGQQEWHRPVKACFSYPHSFCSGRASPTCNNSGKGGLNKNGTRNTTAFQLSATTTMMLMMLVTMNMLCKQH